ncbi:MAG: hypothetical protein ACKOKB_02890 [Bacteroidota bacterium]
MLKQLTTLSIIISIIVAACSSGKRLLENGQYDEAVLTSVKRLRQDPDNSKAAQTLKAAYPYAKDAHQTNVRAAAESSDPLKWERIMDEYGQLNLLADEIKRCPSCLKIVPNPTFVNKELEDARTKAAEARYALCVKCMQSASRQKAKEAYGHFMACQRIIPGFKDVAEQINESRFKATLKVLLEPIPMHSNALKLSNEFFENKIRESLKQMRPNEFVRFYLPGEMEATGLKTADQVIRLRFDDFVIGQTLIKETVLPCKKDSVEIAKDSTGKPIYGTVTAEFHQFNKTVISSGLLDFKVLDPQTRETISQEKFPGTYTWVCEWGYYNGDSRSLTTAQLNLSKNKELLPPPPQQLFIEFCEPIHEQLVNKVLSFYQNY